MVKFCPSCGEHVGTYTVNRYGTEEECCIHCGMVVDGVIQKAKSSTSIAIAADDSPMIRELISDALTNASLASKVIGCADGVEFLSVYTSRLKSGDPVSLVILDVAMPLLNGVNTAIAMRAIEKGFNVPHVPILFFTAHKCDENFQKVLSYCKPAQYVNKGISSTPEMLASRVGQVASMLLHESQKA